MEQLFGIPNYQSVWSFCHPQIKDILRSIPLQNKLAQVGCTERKINTRTAWLNWMHHSDELDFSGCEEKQQWAITNGIHEALVHQLAYVRPTVERYITFEGDYSFYDKILASYPHHKLLPDEIPSIQPNDYVLVSIPNHIGGIPSWYSELIEYANLNGFRIFLDCAFYGTIQTGIVDTSLDCFDAVAFSISKAFLCGGIRSGVVFGNNLAPSLVVPMYRDFNYINVNGMNVAMTILPMFSARFMPDLCRQAQLEICKEFSLEPCDIVFLGKSHDGQWRDKFRPGCDFVRFCLTPLIEQKIKLPSER